MSRKKIKVLLADDHIVVRMGLKAIINIESDLEVVGEAGNGEEALKLIAKLNPDVAIVDLLLEFTHFSNDKMRLPPINKG